MSNTIEVPRWAVVGGGVVLLVAMSTSAFLLGRTTAPRNTTVTITPPSPAAPATRGDTGAERKKPPAPSTTPSAPRATRPKPSQQTTQTTSRSQTRTASAPLTTPSTTPAPSSTADADTTRKVAAYFSSLERIDTAGAGNIDQNALVQQVLGGDVTGIDGLIADHQRRQRSIEAVRPPPPCAAHHAALVKLAADGLSLMQKLRTGIASGNLTSLMSLQPRSVQLQKLGDEVTQMEAELKNQYGLH